MKAIVSICLTIVFFTFLNGCKPNDEKVTAAVNKTLSANASLSQVNASVKDGMVTLTGEVETDEQRSLAESSVAGVKGVKGVTNSISVKPQGPSAGELNRASDNALLSKVNENFATYKVDGITAAVNGGVVTLTGEISRDNLQNAMKAAMEAGAVKVENQMTIK